VAERIRRSVAIEPVLFCWGRTTVYQLHRTAAETADHPCAWFNPAPMWVYYAGAAAPQRIINVQGYREIIADAYTKRACRQNIADVFSTAPTTGRSDSVRSTILFHTRTVIK